MPDSPNLAGRAAVRRFRYLSAGLWALRIGVIVTVLYLVLRTVGGVP
ncbi:MAG: hypothetical protein AAFA34_03140 [Thermoplasmata archaeon]